MEETKNSNSQINQSGPEDDTSAGEQVKKICEALKHHSKVNVFGPPGVGKTRVAKGICASVIKDDSSIFHKTLWAFMCKDYSRQDSLSLSIARQLYLLPSTQEWEDEVDDSKDQKDDADRNRDDKPETSNQNRVKKTKIQEIQDKIKEQLINKKVLLILDDFLDGDTKNEQKFRLAWTKMFPNKEVETTVIIVSRLRRQDEGISDENAFEIKALSSSLETERLLKEKLKVGIRRPERIKALGKKLMEKGTILTPRTVTIIAKALNYFGTDARSEVVVSNLEKELEETPDRSYNVNKLLCHMPDVLPIGILKDFWWRDEHFFRDSGSVHYNEVITYWILERFLGDGSMTELYHKGHDVLMELMDCGAFKPQEDGYVFMDKSVIDTDDLYQDVDQIPSLGLATVYADGFGRITHQEGMLKKPRTRKKNKTQEEDDEGSSSLLLDGMHFNEGFLDSEKKLHVLALFNPTIKSMPKALTKMDNLRVLVLRGCEFLQDFTLPLHGLQVLEISGATSLKSIRSEFFKNMTNLQSLHLSGLQISRLPQVLYESFVKLRWLVVRDCRRLKKIESLTKLEGLTVVDLSGNVNLQAVDKNFLKFKNLQSLNLSKTKVPTTPLLKNIKTLTHLLCRDCKDLGRLRGLTSLTSLQTIDLSGSTEFEEFHDSSLESLSSLRTLNLSGTMVDRLPSNIANPRYLYLKNCLQLERLPCIKSIVDLQVLDFSGSKNLNEIDDGFFDRMKLLRVLNLSETNVETLPSFSKLSNLRQLLLYGCLSLQTLPSLESAEKLEVLDVSECRALKDIKEQSFEAMTCLKKLDFSGTKIKSIPSLSNPSNLRQLLLSNCTELNELELNVSFPHLEELNLSGIPVLEPKNGADFIKDSTSLRVLNLSRTSLEQLPSMSTFTNLTHLSVAGCENLKIELELGECSKLQVLDLSRSPVKHLQNLDSCKNLQKLLLEACSELEGYPKDEIDDILHPNSGTPNAISGFNHLDYFVFPDINNVKEEVNQVEWNICQISDTNKPPFFLSGSQFLKILLMNNDRLPQGPLHLCAIPENVDQGEIWGRFFQRHQLVFRDVYLQTCRFSQYKQNWSLQLRGFEQFPKGIDMIIKNISLLFLIDSKFKSLTSGFDASMVKELKGCWIERCDQLVTIFNDVEGNFEIPVENLGISNNRCLETIYDGKRGCASFNSLKSLYLDCCPVLSTVFPSTWLPKNLEVLQIKYCDKLVSVFEDEAELPKLETLHLWELPELENVTFSFPSLRTLKIWECPKVKQIENFDIAKGLKTLWIGGAKTLKSLSTKYDVIDLETLKLESCPMLEYVMPSCFRNIRIIEIRSCEKLPYTL